MTRVKLIQWFMTRGSDLVHDPVVHDPVHAEPVIMIRFSLNQ